MSGFIEFGKLVDYFLPFAQYDHFKVGYFFHESSEDFVCFVGVLRRFQHIISVISRRENHLRNNI